MSKKNVVIAVALAICLGLFNDEHGGVKATGQLTYQTQWDSCSYWHPVYGEIYAAIMINYDWTYTDGNSHLFSGYSRASDGLCPDEVLDFVEYSQSGYRLEVTNATHAEVYDPDGALVYSN